MEKKNEEFKESKEKMGHFWRKNHDKCGWRKSKGEDQGHFLKNWKEKKVLQIEKLKEKKNFFMKMK